MKKFLVLVCFASVLCLSAVTYGQQQPAHKGYFGVGGSYIAEDVDLASVSLYGAVYEPDFDDTAGINVKVGGYITEYLSLEMNFDYLFESSWSETRYVYYTPVTCQMSAEVWTLMLAGKLFVAPGSLRPFLTAGWGLMRLDLDEKISIPGAAISSSDNETDMCTKLGVGVDYFIDDNKSLGLEVAYVLGHGDLDEIRYFDYTLGFAYHF